MIQSFINRDDETNESPAAPHYQIKDEAWKIDIAKPHGHINGDVMSLRSSAQGMWVWKRVAPDSSLCGPVMRFQTANIAATSLRRMASYVKGKVRRP